jgi:hypothetical protein
MSGKIIIQITELNPKDKKKLLAFAESPYLNTNKNLIKILKSIFKNEDLYRKEISKTKLFNLFFGQIPYDEQTLHNHLSYLKKLYQKFIAFEHFSAKSYSEELYALEFAYQHNQWDYFSNRSKALKKYLDETSLTDSDFHFTAYRLNSLRGYYESSFIDRTKTQHFQSMLDHLDSFYLIEKLKHCCHLKANMILANTHYDFHFLETLFLELAPFETNPTIHLYATIFKTMGETNTDQYYLELKKMVTSDHWPFSNEAAQDLYSFSYNYCILQINKGNSNYQRELFELYKESLRKDILLTNHVLSEWDYKNITTLGCSLKEYDWTLDFIETFKHKLAENRKENAYNYCKAHWFFSNKMYDNALESLRFVQYTDVKYHISTTFLTIRTYYEKQDTEALLSLLDTFRIYVLRNKKINSSEKKGYTNFVRYTKQLALLYYITSEQELQKKLIQLHQNVSATTDLINKSWLLNEISKKQSNPTVVWS